MNLKKDGVLKTNGRLNTKERLARIVKEEPPAHIKYDAFSDLDKTIIIENTPIILIRKNLSDMLGKKQLKKFGSFGLKAVYNWFEFKYKDDANYYYKTLYRCKDFREQISREVNLRKEWPELVRLRRYKKVGVITQNDVEFANLILNQLRSKRELDGIELSLYMANEIKVNDGIFTSRYKINFDESDLVKILNGKPFINYDVQNGGLFVKNG